MRDSREQTWQVSPVDFICLLLIGTGCHYASVPEGRAETLLNLGLVEEDNGYLRLSDISRTIISQSEMASDTTPASGSQFSETETDVGADSYLKAILEAQPEVTPIESDERTNGAHFVYA